MAAKAGSRGSIVHLIDDRRVGAEFEQQLDGCPMSEHCAVLQRGHAPRTRRIELGSIGIELLRIHITVDAAQWAVIRMHRSVRLSHSYVTVSTAPSDLKYIAVQRAVHCQHNYRTVLSVTALHIHITVDTGATAVMQY